MKRSRCDHMMADSLQTIKPVSPDPATEVLASKDPFRQFYLEQVQVIVEKECNIRNLHELLKMASPAIAMDQIKNKNDRDKALKVLKLRIHPDKHPNTAIIATKLFQEVQAFFDKCCENLHTDMVESSDLPQKFRVQFSWPHLGNEFEPVSGRSVQNEKDLSKLMACRCINARGAIAHGKPTGLVFDTSDFREGTVDDIFTSRADGFRVLSSVDEIKEELMTRGPVVSTSHRLSQGFGENKHSSSFLLSQVGKTHPLLIVGWKFTKFGDVWVVNHLDYNSEHMIAFGHFDIDQRCIAPLRTFENDAWQSGPYFRFDFSSNPSWRENDSFAVLMSSSRLELLASCFDTGLFDAITSRTEFELCDQTKMAHSRTCVLKELTWDSNVDLWKVFVEFTD